MKQLSAPLNIELAEMLARRGEESSGILFRAFKRAARSAFLWPERAADLVAASRPLTELHGVGPFIAKQLLGWIENPAGQRVTIPAIRRDFLTRADARVILAARPEWTARLRGDLQMHTRWIGEHPGNGAGGEGTTLRIHFDYRSFERVENRGRY